MDSKRLDDQYSEQEATLRRDEVLRRMMARPHQPHRPLKALKAKTRPTSKGRIRKGRSRS